MVIRYLSHWVKSFIFLIMDQLLRDNGGVMIIYDPSFLIRGARIMETGHFSFYMSRDHFSFVIDYSKKFVTIL